MKKQIRYIGVMICMMYVLSGCGIKAPSISPSEVTSVYLEAMRTQNSDEMAKHSLSGAKESFTLNQEEITALGLDVTFAQNFLTHIMNFQYELDEESIYLSEESANVVLKLKTYDVETIITQAVENHKEKFKEISASKISDLEKQKQISDIIIADFENAEKTIETSYIVQLKIKDKEWKIKDLDGKFYNILLHNE